MRHGTDEIMIIAALVLLAIIGYVTWFMVQRTLSVATPTSPGHKPEPARRSTTKDEASTTKPVKLIDMPEATSSLLSYPDERQAAKAQQRIWMRYRNKAGQVTEHIIEIYRPKQDEVVLAWCCLHREPRTFARQNIECWQLLPERFEFDPLVDQYLKEEGMRDMSLKRSWDQWLDAIPASIARRYR